jgi:hypothetical protein
MTGSVFPGSTTTRSMPALTTGGKSGDLPESYAFAGGGTSGAIHFEPQARRGDLGKGRGVVPVGLQAQAGGAGDRNKPGAVPVQ